MPSRKGSKKNEAKEGEDDSDDTMTGQYVGFPVLGLVVNSHEVWKDDGVFECLGNPNQIERILVDRDKIRQR